MHLKKLGNRIVGRTLVAALVLSSVTGIFSVTKLSKAYGATTPLANWNNVCDYNYICLDGDFLSPGHVRGSVYVDGSVVNALNSIDDNTPARQTVSYVSGTDSANGSWRRNGTQHYSLSFNKTSDDTAYWVDKATELWNKATEKIAVDKIPLDHASKGDNEVYEIKKVYVYFGTGTLKLTNGNTGVQGIIIAPYATVEFPSFGGNWAGTVVAKNVIGHTGESHMGSLTDYKVVRVGNDEPPKKPTPTTKPTTTPSTTKPTTTPSTTKPTTKPTTTPSTTKPTTKPTTAPTTKPTTKPTTTPSTTKPTTTPSTTKPGNDPTTKPGNDPTTKPGNDPTTKPGDPGNNPTTDPKYKKKSGAGDSDPTSSNSKKKKKQVEGDDDDKFTGDTTDIDFFKRLLGESAAVIVIAGIAIIVSRKKG